MWLVFFLFIYVFLAVLSTRSESCKIFVGGLASEVTEKEFGDYFSQYGIVKDAVVMVDRNTGSSRGFGCVCNAILFICSFASSVSVAHYLKVEVEKLTIISLFYSI